MAAGRHLLISAPTGTGKGLAPFLPLLLTLQGGFPINDNMRGFVVNVCIVPVIRSLDIGTRAAQTFR